MKKAKAALTVEAAWLFPLILMIWMFVLFGLFYYHDKNILAGAAYETAVMGSEWLHEEEELPQGKLGSFFQERIQGKLLYFGGASVDIREQNGRIQVSAQAEGKRMSLSVTGSAAVTVPEEYIRGWIRAGSLGNKIWEEVGN